MNAILALIAMLAVIALVVCYIKAFRRAWQQFRITKKLEGWQILVLNLPLVVLVSNPIAMLLSIAGVSIWRTSRDRKNRMQPPVPRVQPFESGYSPVHPRPSQVAPDGRWWAR